MKIFEILMCNCVIQRIFEKWFVLINTPCSYSLSFFSSYVLLLRSVLFGSIPMWNNNNQIPFEMSFGSFVWQNQIGCHRFCIVVFILSALSMFVFAFLLVFLQTILFSFVVRHSFNPQIFFFHPNRHRS